jgi:uncharacterized membrane protein HdeD (DUF308 family)
MPKLDDFLEPLFSGTREVEVPKSQVSEPLDSDWKLSKINIPSSEMIGSYRKGRLHVHEFEKEYRVHLDKYDPKKHPTMHLIDDAPLVLMIWGTMSALSLETNATAKGRSDKRISDLRGTYWSKILLGVLLASIGIMLMLSPLHYAEVFVSIVLPLVVVVLGLYLIYQALRHAKEGKRGIGIAIGVIIVILGLSMFYFWESVADIILLVLAAWFLGSAALSIKSALAQGGIKHEGVVPKLILGLLSLALAILIFLMPELFVAILFILMGAIVLLAGILLIVGGNALRKISKEMAAEAKAQSA